MGISRVRVTFSKALGRFAQGYTPGFNPAEWSVQEDQNVSSSTEFKADNSTWFAQRVTTTNSAGRLLFGVDMRIPAGTGIPVGASLDVSLFNDASNGPTGFSLSGNFILEQVITNIANSIFSKPQPGKADPAIQGGFISFPLINVIQRGTDSVEDGTKTFRHFFEFPAQVGQTWLPFKSYWFVMRTTSAAGINVYVNEYTAFGGADIFGYFTNNGTTFNFQNGKSSTFTLYGNKSLSNPATTSNQGASAQITMTEPVTGIVFPATSLLAQDHIASEISFNTSVVARRNNMGFVDVAFPMSAGGFTNLPGLSDGLARMDYSCEITYTSFK